MTIKHHPEEATLMAYATGNLPEAFNLVIAAHISLCDQCRATVEACDAVGGSLLAQDDAVAMSDDSLAKVMARLDDAPPPMPRKNFGGIFPAPLQTYVGGDLDAVNWRPIGMGVKQAVLTTSSEASARLLRVPGGAAIPDHSHRGTELTLVLQGAFVDEQDRFSRGDLEVADGSITHTPTAVPGEDCICLIVTDAPLAFKGLIPRVVQKFAKL